MSNNNTKPHKDGLFSRMWQALKKPSVKYPLGTLLVTGFFSGIIFWGGFNTAMVATNSEEFCLSCHEMYAFPYQEYKETIHYSNRSGVRATCSDCHVPKEWHHKVVRKVVATRELWHTALGTIDTEEEFEGKRLELAQRVWRSMEASDSRECRNCHEFEFMDFGEQGRRAVDAHVRGFEEGKTCINCHKGIAHKLPDMRGVDPDSAIGNI